MSRADEAYTKLKECQTNIKGLEKSLEYEERKRKALEWEYRRESVNRVLNFLCKEYRGGRLCNLNTVLTHCINKLNGNIDGVELLLDGNYRGKEFIITKKEGGTDE